MRLLAFIASLILVATQVSAEQSSSLWKLVKASDTVGLEAVGRVDMARVGYCTGTLIAPDLVLTAAHCLFDGKTGALIKPETITFRAGYRDGVSVAERKVTRAIHNPRYVYSEKPSQDMVTADVALLMLEKPISSNDAAPFAVHSGRNVKGQLSVISYGRGRENAMSWQRECNLLARVQKLIVFDCNVTHGSSGAAVFVRENGRYRILSVVSSGGRSDGETVGFGMELGEQVAALKARIRGTLLQQTAAVKRIKIGSGASGLNSGSLLSGASNNKSRRTTTGGARFIRVGD